jgi:predicted ATP-dependent protease
LSLQPSELDWQRQSSLTFFFFCSRSEFIHLIASEANEICEKETKKTIAGEHVISALQTLGFEDYVEEVDEVYKEHKKQQKVCVLFLKMSNGCVGIMYD